MFKLMIILFYLFGLVGCSSGIKKEEVTKNSNVLIMKPKKFVDVGPSLKKSTVFKDRTYDYGLGNIKGRRFYAVDFNLDSFTDLVILESNYAIPQFYKFDSLKSKFIKLSYNPFSKNLKASYLNFIDLNNDGIKDVVVGLLNQKTELTKLPVRLFQGVFKDKKINYIEKGFVSKKTDPTSSISVIDYNLDGKLDIFYANWFDYSLNQPIPEFDKLFKATSSFSFKEDSARLIGEKPKKNEKTLRLTARPTFGVSTCDLDQNGYPDMPWAFICSSE